jgi:beta-lactamase regulating signal transducer with metallopeptidase domain
LCVARAEQKNWFKPRKPAESLKPLQVNLAALEHSIFASNYTFSPQLFSLEPFIMTNDLTYSPQEPSNLVHDINEAFNSLSTIFSYVTLFNVILCLWGLFFFVMTLFAIIYIKKLRERKALNEGREKLVKVKIERYWVKF